MNGPPFPRCDWRVALDDILADPPAVPDTAEFPSDAMRRIVDAGLLLAPLPRRFGGAGVGTEAGLGPAAFAFFHMLGRFSLPVGRLVEAHVNALRIVMRYGTEAQAEALAERVLSGALLALWVTDPPDNSGLMLKADGMALRIAGRKMFCSGAGAVQAAIMTAFDPVCGDWQLILLPMDGSERIGPLPAGLSGMRAAITGQIDVPERVLAPEALIGLPGDYLREPDFSAGAWRSSAVALGGLHRLVEWTGRALQARRRDGDAHQRARFGRLVTAHETGRLWLTRAAEMAEALSAPSEEIVATVGLARLAVEEACLEAITQVQRALGLSAFLMSSPVEPLMRDLQTYLRQPAADEILHGAAGFFLTHPLPHS